MTSAGAQTSPERRSPLAHLLHALNQPLTGLQCSLELASTGLRSPEQYRHTIHEGLELAARMRVLVEALRELVDTLDPKRGEAEPFLLDVLLRDMADGLLPVAESREVRIYLATVGPLRVQADHSLAQRMFRLLDAALSLARPQSDLQIAVAEELDAVSVAISWCPGALPEHSPFSRPELGLLVAQSEWEVAGAEWSQVRSDATETCSVRFPLGSS